MNGVKNVHITGLELMIGTDKKMIISRCTYWCLRVFGLAWNQLSYADCKAVSFLFLQPDHRWCWILSVWGAQHFSAPLNQFKNYQVGFLLWFYASFNLSKGWAWNQEHLKILNTVAWWPGEGDAKITVAGPIFDYFCIIQAKITDLGLLLVPINRDTLTNLKTENGGVVKGHNKKRRK